MNELANEAIPFFAGAAIALWLYILIPIGARWARTHRQMLKQEKAARLIEEEKVSQRTSGY